MTTIAWDGDTLAADRCSWSGGARRTVRKAFKITMKDGETYLCAFFGSGEFAHAVMEWMTGTLSTPPDCSSFGVDPETACAVVIDKKKRIWLLGARLRYMRMREKKFAVGAGHEFAWGALEAGASAKQAVMIAAKRSDYAGLGVDCVSF
ncbi:MAG: hypothetical protein ACYCW7_17560 [Pseudomonadaceae bacterium]